MTIQEQAREAAMYFMTQALQQATDAKLKLRAEASYNAFVRWMASQ